jgi:D-amino-acid dehydrogenase
MAGGTPHCVVIGAGIVGSSCAWHLQNDGAQVTLIDSELPGQSTSSGNASCLSPTSIFPFSYPGAIRKVPGWLLDPLGPMKIRWAHLPQLTPWLWRFWRAGSMQRVIEIAKAQQTLMKDIEADYDQILAECDAESMRKSRGLIKLFDSEELVNESQWEFDLRREFGIEMQVLSKEELRSLEPSVELGNGIAFMDPAWQHLLDPGDVTRSISDAALARGAAWVHDRVSGVSASNSGVSVQTLSGRSIEADMLVIAAGVWSNVLIGQLGHRVPLIAKRGYHSMLLRPAVQLDHPLMAISEYVVMTPMRDGLRVAGTAEFAAIDAEPDYRRAKALLNHARKYIPDIAGEEVTEWMGQRPMMPDSLAVIGQLPGHRNVLCAFGHGHYGLTQGPTTGRIISSLVFAREPGIDLSPFAADRF